MGAALTRGTTFTDGQQGVDVATFTPLLTAATIVGVDRENTASSLALATHDTEDPAGMQNGEVSQDSVANDLFSKLSGTVVPATSRGVAFTLSSLSAAVSPGHVICPSQHTEDDATENMEICSQTNGFFWIGVSARAVSPGGSGFYIRRGPALLKSTGAIPAGRGVRISSTDGVVEAMSVNGIGGKEVLGTALKAASGGYVWVNLKGC